MTDFTFYTFFADNTAQDTTQDTTQDATQQTDQGQNANIEHGIIQYRDCPVDATDVGDEM